MDDFIRRIQKRAIEKRAEMQKEQWEEQRANAPLGPGGLNPFDVLEQLPENLRQAFDDQDTEALQTILSEMEPKEGGCGCGGVFVGWYEILMCVDVQVGIG